MLFRSFYLPGHDVDIGRADVIGMPTELLQVFDEVFQPVDDIAQAFRDSVVSEILIKAGVE